MTVSRGRRGNRGQPCFAKKTKMMAVKTVRIMVWMMDQPKRKGLEPELSVYAALLL